MPRKNPRRGPGTELCAALLAACCLASCGGTPPGGQVVVYVSVDEHVAKPILQEFEDRTGIDVLMVGDTEARKTTGLVERLRAERDHPVADVFWSSEAMQTIDLAEDGVLARCEQPELVDWPKSWRDSNWRWFGFSPRPRVIAYNPDRTPAGDVPATWEAATDPRWKNRIVLADPRFGTTGGHLGVMATLWPERYGEFLRGLQSNEARMLPGGNAAVVDAIVHGEAGIGFTDADDVRAAQRRGLPVAMVYPWHEPGTAGGGTFMMPNTVAIVSGGPNPAAGRQLLMALLSDETARALAASVSGNVPLQPGVASEFPELRIEEPLEIDLTEAATGRASAIERAMSMLRPGSTSP